MEVQGDPGNLRTTMVYCVKRSITDTGEYAAVNIRVKLGFFQDSPLRRSRVGRL